MVLPKIKIGGSKREEIMSRQGAMNDQNPGAAFRGGITKILIVMLLGSALAACTKEPTSTSMVEFENPRVSFRIDSFEAGGPVPNRHEVTLLAVNDGEDDTKIFEGYGGSVPQITQIATGKYSITYEYGRRYELRSEKQYFASLGNGFGEIEVLLFKVEQEW